jgi:beta-glucosidase
MTVHSLSADEQPWMNVSLSPDERARLLESALTDDERYGVLHSQWAVGFLPGMTVPEGAVPGAGYVAPIPRLGVPGPVRNGREPRRHQSARRASGRHGDGAPLGAWAGVDLGPELAFEAGAAIADEAAKKGFNVLLAGGVNLTRDPRNGRNFEYLGEDPLLAGVMAGESVRGIESEGVISTVKHFALNDQETGRHVVNAVIEEGALRESDLLAFQIAIERGRPGAVMSAYNKVNGFYASENSRLLNDVLKGRLGLSGLRHGGLGRHRQRRRGDGGSGPAIG